MSENDPDPHEPEEGQGRSVLGGSPVPGDGDPTEGGKRGEIGEVRPAASSAARLMRKPEESFSSDLLIWLSVTDRLRYEFSAAMLLLTVRPMGSSSLDGVTTASVPRSLLPCQRTRPARP